MEMYSPMYSSGLEKRIKEKDDIEVVNLFNFFAENLINDYQPTFNEILYNIPPTTRVLSTFKKIESNPPENNDILLNKKDSITISRELLLFFSKHEIIKNSLQKALDNFVDNLLSAEVRVSIGRATSVILIGSTGELNGKPITNIETNTEAIKEILQKNDRSFNP